MSNTVKLIPGGCIQFIDLELDLQQLDQKFKRYFYDCTSQLLCLDEKDNGEEFIDRQTGSTAKYPSYTDVAWHKPGRVIQEPSYLISREDALEPFLDQWIPLPFFRLEGNLQLNKGPSNWARGRISKITERKIENKGKTHALTIAFDTQVEPALAFQQFNASTPENSVDPQQFNALTPEDVANGSEFVLAKHEIQYTWFVLLDWVDKWLKHLFEPFDKQKGIKNIEPEEGDQRSWEHIARYITFLDILYKSGAIPKVQVMSLNGHNAIPVDLILDVGNSRTCGVMVERLDEEKVMGLNDIFQHTYVLEIRNLSDPTKRYREPFESRVEFSLPNFGDPNQYANASGRITEAFSWPSPVRTGPEAQQLGFYSRSEQGRTGMSSPKRYLWDQYERSQKWRYNSGTTSGEELPVIKGPFVLHINDLGTPIRPLEDADKAIVRDRVYRDQMDEDKGYMDPVTDPKFTRSSLMMFMLSEIISHALVTINSPGLRQRRPHPHLPRQLRRVVLTMPTAMTIAERKIFARWAEWAVEMVWQSMGWWNEIKQILSDLRDQGRELDEQDLKDLLESEWIKSNDSTFSVQEIENMLGYRDFRLPPTITYECDEASATHLVYLTNEVIQKYRGKANSLFQLLGSPRKSMESPRNALRIASIDIGGGTTDLMITTYGEKTTASATVIRPKQEFGESFNIAGDDILKAVIEQHVLRSIKKAIAKSGVHDPKGVLTSILGGDFSGASQTEEDRFLRYQFATQVAVPIGLKMLEHYESFDPKAGNKIFNEEFGKFFIPPNPPAKVISFIDKAVMRAGGKDFSLQRVEFEINMVHLDQTVRNTIDPIVGSLSEIIHLYSCDILLLTGRPSKLPAVRTSLLSKMPLPPNRIIPMHDYRIGGWYPFRNVNNRVEDPKTTTTVGAVLNAFSEGYLERYRFEANRLKPKSTCRFMGSLTIDGYIKKEDVFFDRPLDLDGKEPVEETHVIDYYAPMYIGFRQLASERWPATPFYRLVFADNKAIERAKNCLPYKVELKFLRKGEDANNTLKSSSGIGDINDEGSVTHVQIIDAKGRSVPSSHLELRLQTLRSEGEEGHFWMDTGIFKVL